MAVFFEHFKTLNELAQTIESRERNELFKQANKEYSMEKVEKNDIFFGSQSFDEAIDLLTMGYKEPLADLKREVLKVTRQNVQAKPKPFQSVVGYAPHVPNAIRGIPTSMINRENKLEKAKTIHLLYGFSAVGNVNARDLINGGTKFIGLVNSLEMAGYRVKIDIIRCTTSSTTNAIGYTCTLKEYSQSLNLLKLCFPLVHPSMLRRISFRWCETLPNLTDNHYTLGYGTSLIVRMGWRNNKNLACEKEKAFLKKHGILKDKNQYYCNVYEAMDAKNVQDLAQKMGLSQ